MYINFFVLVCWGLAIATPFLFNDRFSDKYFFLIVVVSAFLYIYIMLKIVNFITNRFQKHSSKPSKFSKWDKYIDDDDD